MLVQPKRKSYNKHPSMHRGDTWASMMAREEIECAGPPSVNHDGPVMWVAAQPFDKPIKWGTSMDSYSKEQLKRLTEDGHIITYGKRAITFEPNFNAYRATQLFSIPHEIGHYVDYCSFYEEERKNYLAAQHKKASTAAARKMHPRKGGEDGDEETEKQKEKEKEGEEEEEEEGERQENGESEKLLIGVTKQKWLNEKSSTEEHKKKEAKEELKEEEEQEQEEQEQEEKMNEAKEETEAEKETKEKKANEAEEGAAAEKEQRRKQQEDMRRMKKERDAIEQRVIPVFNAKPYIEKERFANAFADEVKAALLKKGIPFPFPRKDDAVATKDKGIRQQDFFLPSFYNE